jgi:hypothetical protein
VGEQYVLGLDVGLPVDRLRKPVRDVLSGASDSLMEEAG